MFAAKPNTRKSRFTRWRKGIGGQKFIVGVAFLVVPLILLFVFTYLPFFKMFEFSLYKMKYLGSRTFIGLENYIDVFQRDDIFSSLKLSFYYMGGALLQMALALFFATILSFKIKGSNFFKGAIFFPFLVNGIALGFIFKFFYTRGFVLDSLLGSIGFDTNSLPYWLKDTGINNISLVATSVWKYMGQNMVLFIGAIMSVDPNMYEAAEIDGANKWHKFIYIILPSIRTIVLLNLILSITGSLSAFEPPFVITKGNFGTATYFVTMHTIAHENQKVGLASAMAVVLMGIIVLATIAQKLLFRYAFHEDDDGTGTSKRAQKRALKRNRYSSERRSVTFAKTDGKVRPFSKMQVKPVSAADTERSR
jgi:multiple sugar transport system permease protein